MTDNKRQFDAFLKKEEEKKKPQINWDARKEEWIGFIDKLYADIELWLNDYIITHQIKLEFNEFDIYEEAIGRYTVRELKIYIGSHTAKLTPIGTVLIGTRGRVDLTGKFGTIKFILADKDSTKPNISVNLVLESEEEENRYQEERKELAQKKVELVWKISSNPPSIRYTDLNEDTLYDSLIKVING